MNGYIYRDESLTSSCKLACREKQNFGYIKFLIAALIIHIPVTAIWMPIRLVHLGRAECFAPWFLTLFTAAQTLLACGILASTFAMKGKYDWNIDIAFAGCDGAQKLAFIFGALLIANIPDPYMIAVALFFILSSGFTLSIPMIYHDEKPKFSLFATIPISLILGLIFAIQPFPDSVNSGRFVLWIGILFIIQAIGNMLLIFFKSLHTHFTQAGQN